MNDENKLGNSTLSMNSSLTEEGGVDPSSSQEVLIKEAIHVMSSKYEDRTLWGYEVLQKALFHFPPSMDILYFKILKTGQGYSL